MSKIYDRNCAEQQFASKQDNILYDIDDSNSNSRNDLRETYDITCDTSSIAEYESRDKEYYLN